MLFIGVGGCGALPQLFCFGQGIIPKHEKSCKLFKTQFFSQCNSSGVDGVETASDVVLLLRDVEICEELLLWHEHTFIGKAL